MKRRASGILLHVTSLPSPYGIGDAGPGAYRFVDFLAETGQSYWQILPLNPTDPDHHNSPYHSFSAFASNPWLISPERLIEDGLLDKKDLTPAPGFSRDRVNYQGAIEYKERLFARAFARFMGQAGNFEYEKFCSENKGWLDDFALFVALKDRFGGRGWCEWPQEIRDREPGALQGARQELHQEVEMNRFLQFVFAQQWYSLKRYCHEKDIQIIGDIPIYVDQASADVWAHPDLFALDEAKRPAAVAGVPPDYFSETGQLWGNPLYRWDVLRERKYDWWIQRIAQSLKRCDALRIDHFRGLVAYWEVPADEETAIHGKWTEAPVWEFLDHLARRFPSLPFIAEDLGLITPDVREVMRHFELPGMKVLLFAFGGDSATNPYVPHNHVRNCVAYTGTHDNNTVRGWFEAEATPEEKSALSRYLGREVPVEDLHWELIRMIMMSVANTVIFPMQDVLGLGGDARMNRPASLDGNWEWRLSADLLNAKLAGRLLDMTRTYGRA
jgi:4-alpha-glucanotransferase